MGDLMPRDRVQAHLSLEMSCAKLSMPRSTAKQRLQASQAWDAVSNGIRDKHQTISELSAMISCLVPLQWWPPESMGSHFQLIHMLVRTTVATFRLRCLNLWALSLFVVVFILMTGAGMA